MVVTQGNVSVEDVARRARVAARAMLSLSTREKNGALEAIHATLKERRREIEEANEEDKQVAKGRLARNDISPTLVKRLDVTGAKFEAMLANVSSVCALPDPVDACTLSRELDEGLQLYRVACPIGVICVIFEARPEVVVQIAALAVKSANAVILKGGKEAERSNKVLVECVRDGLQKSGFPVDAVQLVETREQVRELLDQSQYIDLIIPRGSNQLVSFITQNTRIPVMGHADGICCVYVDKMADAKKARDVVVDSKAQYPAVCNATETLLVHEQVVDTVLVEIGKGLAEAGVEVRVEESVKGALKGVEGLKVEDAKDEDYDTEFLQLVLAVKVVKSMEEAAEHINQHGSGHTDSIVTEDDEVAKRFLRLVDSAGVYHNASTRFADGFRYGFGAEVGVSTHRTHARGPVGLEGLMIYKYKLLGNGHCVRPYVEGEKTLRHKDTPDRMPPL